MTMGIVQIEPRHAGAFMVSEAPGRLSRDRFVVALNQSLAAGQVVGKTAVTSLVTSSAAADGSNTGNGVITMDATAPVAPSAKNGVYRVVNELVATNSGEFVVYDPDGIEIGRVGWKTIGEAQRYIEEANRIKLAESAGEKVISRTGIGKPKNQFAKKGRKSLKKRKVKS